VSWNLSRPRLGGGFFAVIVAAMMTAAGAADTAHAQSTLYVLKRFAGANGATPQSPLLPGASGALYGTTANGGKFGSGLVFELMPPGRGQTLWTERPLYDFCATPGCMGGTVPLAGLTPDGAGGFFGTTSVSGGHGWGTVFQLHRPRSATSGWSLTVVYSFCAETSCSDGAGPAAAVVRGPGGVLYGTTYSGGAKDYGAVFSLTPPAKGQTTWSYAVIHDFDFHDGAGPLGDLVLGGGGELYGTTSVAGTHGHGAAFELKPPAKAGGAWSFRVLYQFCAKRNCIDGANPYSGLLLTGSGALYGTTQAGGPGGWGTVYELIPPDYGTLRTLHNFVFRDGAAPVGGLVQDRAGAIYGTTSLDGAYGYGTVFRLTRSGNERWTETVLHDFKSTDGAGPVATLTLGKSGVLYGSTEYGGGPNNDGAAFELTP
jgi:uncharacterized repeat protein (TIGR03803 family)